jgi:hypothetical protein
MWYYADGERQQGPVAADELRRLVEIGEIKPSDLVWQPGMQDWVPAQAIRGLVPEDLRDASLADLRQEAIDAGFEDARRPLSRRRRRRAGARWDPEALNRLTGRYAKWFVLAGFVLLILGRGFDVLGFRIANRQLVALDVAKSDLEADFRKRRMALQTKLIDVQRRSAPTERDQQLIADYQRQIAQLEQDYSRQQSDLSQSTWLDLDIASKAALSKHVVWRPFYELLVFVGSLVLAVGLTSIAFNGEVVERWGSWLLLGLLLFYLLIWWSSTAGS